MSRKVSEKKFQQFSCLFTSLLISSVSVSFSVVSAFCSLLRHQFRSEICQLYDVCELFRLFSIRQFLISSFLVVRSCRVPSVLYTVDLDSWVISSELTSKPHRIFPSSLFRCSFAWSANSHNNVRSKVFAPPIYK